MDGLLRSIDASAAAAAATRQEEERERSGLSPRFLSAAAGLDFTCWLPQQQLDADPPPLVAPRSSGSPGSSGPVSATGAAVVGGGLDFWLTCGRPGAVTVCFFFFLISFICWPLAAQICIFPNILVVLTQTASLAAAAEADRGYRRWSRPPSQSCSGRRTPS